jgi:hypothetical protein
MLQPQNWRATLGNQELVLGRHRRSPEALLRRKLRHYILSRSFRDREKSESVCLLTRDDLLAFAGSAGSGSISDVPDVEKGEILLDSRGQGSFQRPESS